MSASENNRPTIGVSVCLLGHAVGFDGRPKRAPFISAQLSRVMDFIPVCPQREAGLGAPRPTIQLRRVDDAVKLVQPRNPSIDCTESMAEIAIKCSRELNGRISGFIFQKKSPACGMERVPVVQGKGRPAERNGTGMLTQHYTRHCALIPIEEKGRLNNPVLRKNFLERVYALDRWYRLEQTDLKGFVDFHSYKASQIPLAAPITLLSHHLRKHPDAYLARQHYFKPYPDTLALRALV